MQVSMAQTKMNTIHKMSHKTNGAAKTSRGRHNSSGNLLRSICANQFNYSGSIGLYTKNGLNGYSANVNISITNINISITDSINKPEIDIDKLRELIDNSIAFNTSGNIGECKGVKFYLSDIKPMKTYGLEENKAVDNVLDFGDMKYSKYISSDGKEHVLYARHGGGGIETPFSNLITGVERDEETEKYTSFWSYFMQRDTVYANMSFSNDEITKYLSEAGIEKGFFTIKSGGNEITKYYSSSKNTNIIQDQWRYDQHYNAITNGILFQNYEPGSIFKVGGKEYILNENHALDVSYGEDIFDMEYPANYKFGKKID